MTSGIQVVSPAWRRPPPGLTVFSTTRHGGVSDAPYDSLNLGLHSGDDDVAVKRNRQLLVESFQLPSEPMWLKQVHGTGIVRIDAVADQSTSGSTSGPTVEADGAWTDRPGCVLAVLTADCLPVIIAAADGSAVAVVHAGWRGLAAGIVQGAVDCFDDEPPLMAWLGPAIGPTAFEVGAEVREAFLDRNPALDSAFRDHRDRYLCDLYAIARADLEACGVPEITGGEYCTLSEVNDFHSYRRDGQASGRMATIAWID